MEMIYSQKVKTIKLARPIIDDLQERLLRAEDLLQDLSRAVEIAQYSGQYQLVDSFRQSAETHLQDRLERPDSSISADQQRIVLVSGTDKTNESAHTT
jgi:cell fate (sporulation/competence/biofilm development) regulator YmcA (YheA/YmcA/DUF963 family)